jgi:hypothetical protein
MSRLSAAGKLDDYDLWFEKFLPQLFDPDFILEPGLVKAYFYNNHSSLIILSFNTFLMIIIYHYGK